MKKTRIGLGICSLNFGRRRLRLRMSCEDWVCKRKTDIERLWGGLAFSLVLYGLTSGAPGVVATGVGALLATLAHLHIGERESEREHYKLISRPAYVLLKAREILSRT